MLVSQVWVYMKNNKIMNLSEKLLMKIINFSKFSEQAISCKNIEISTLQPCWWHLLIYYRAISFKCFGLIILKINENLKK